MIACLVLTACGGGDGGTKGTVGGTLPACAQAGSAIALPPSLSALPLPRGSVIDGTRVTPAGDTVFEGFVPGDLGAARDFFNEELPKSGYELGEGDAEEHEAETEFEGHGGEGHLKLRDIAGCDGALTLELGVR